MAGTGAGLRVQQIQPARGLGLEDVAQGGEGGAKGPAGEGRAQGGVMCTAVQQASGLGRRRWLKVGKVA